METILALLTAKDTKKAMNKFKELEEQCLSEPLYADRMPATTF